MIEHVRGNLLAADVDALVNPVNCAGVMGAGLALLFREAFPDNFAAYVAACSEYRVRPGEMLIFETTAACGPKFIVNFPTKLHWRYRSRLKDIVIGLASLVKDVARLDIKSIAIPRLGCGLGGLNWDDVRPLIERAFEDANIHVLIFAP